MTLHDGHLLKTQQFVIRFFVTQSVTLQTYRIDVGLL